MLVVSDAGPGRIVHLISGEAACERAREIAPALRAAGYDVRQRPRPRAAAGGRASGGARRRRRAGRRSAARRARRAAAAAREALETSGLLLLADERAALAVAEAMRLLLDERGLGWDEAWARAARAHLVPRSGSPKSEPARPFWTIAFLASEQPRLLEILYEINRRHLDAGGSALARRPRAPAPALAVPRGRAEAAAAGPARRAGVAPRRRRRRPGTGPIGESARRPLGAARPRAARSADARVRPLVAGRRQPRAWRRC